MGRESAFITEFLDKFAADLLAPLKRFKANYSSPKQKLLRIAGGGLLGAAGIGYGVKKLHESPEQKHIRAMQERSA